MKHAEQLIIVTIRVIRPCVIRTYVASMDSSLMKKCTGTMVESVQADFIMDVMKPYIVPSGNWKKAFWRVEINVRRMNF